MSGKRADDAALAGCLGEEERAYFCPPLVLVGAVTGLIAEKLVRATGGRVG